MSDNITQQPHSEVVKQFQGIPMADLIGGPLKAACDAQVKLADAFFDYVNKLTFDEKGKTRLLEFDVNRPVETPTGTGTIPIHVQAPLLGMVPVPSLLIDAINIDFQMEVTSTQQDTSRSGNEENLKISGSHHIPFCGSVSIDVQGKVTSSRESTRSTNQTAKYQVSVNAQQQQPTEGMNRLMDIMASCTAALGSSPGNETTQKKE